MSSLLWIAMCGIGFGKMKLELYEYLKRVYLSIDRCRIHKLYTLMVVLKLILNNKRCTICMYLLFGIIDNYSNWLRVRKL